MGTTVSLLVYRHLITCVVCQCLSAYVQGVLSICEGGGH
jgi:hypothetical protein